MEWGVYGGCPLCPLYSLLDILVNRGRVRQAVDPLISFDLKRIV